MLSVTVLAPEFSMYQQSLIVCLLVLLATGNPAGANAGSNTVKDNSVEDNSGSGNVEDNSGSGNVPANDCSKC